jgi:ABC-type uncharacterized transport system permease subunit
MSNNVLLYFLECLCTITGFLCYSSKLTPTFNSTTGYLRLGMAPNNPNSSLTLNYIMEMFLSMLIETLWPNKQSETSTEILKSPKQQKTTLGAI